VSNSGTPGFDPARLRRHRDAAGLSQAELSRRAGVPRAAISKYEAGQASPNPDRLAVIARTLGIEPVDLLNLQEVGRGLASLRITKGLLQSEVAELAGPDMTVGRYRMLELGKVVKLSEHDATDLARVFGVTKEAVRTAHRQDLPDRTDPVSRHDSS
jgi:transcriptional regulator with XRE-family HTH domain